MLALATGKAAEFDTKRVLLLFDFVEVDRLAIPNENHSIVKKKI